MSPPRFSIVVPVYNEAAVLRELIERCMATGQGLGDPFELIVVNDGSTDSTGEIARSLSQDGLEVLDLARNGGQFQATVQGVRAATGVWVAVLDGDLQDPPETLAATLQAAGVEAGPVRDFQGLHADPQLAARTHFVPLEHPVLGRLAYERSGARLTRTPGRLHRPAPRLGEHTQSILSGILGLSDQEIESLAEADVTR